MMFKLRSINKILRWTGWRLAVEIDCENFAKSKREPTKIGFVWYGWDFIRHLDVDLKD